MAGNKIDYKDYLKQFGSIETDAKNRIKAYLEEQIENDAALKALYRPEKIDDCYDFIKNAVKATGCGSSATIEDAVVFKMARDYFLDYAGAETAAEAETEAETELETEEEIPADNENSGTPCEEAEPENEKPAEKEEVMLHQADEAEGESVESENSEAETEQATEEEKLVDNENEAEKDYCGFEIFGEEKPEASAETAASAETKAEPENEKPAEAPKYDKDGNGLLFDF